MASTTSFASTLDITGKGKVNIKELFLTDVTNVLCKSKNNIGPSDPKCILKKECYGVHYPGQKFEEVDYNCTATEFFAIQKIKRLRKENICK